MLAHVCTHAPTHTSPHTCPHACPHTCPALTPGLVSTLMSTDMRITMPQAGFDLDQRLVLKLCIEPAAGSNQSLPSDVGGGNYHWEDHATGRAAAFAYGGSGDGRLFDLTCAPGYMKGNAAGGLNATAILHASAGWAGSHAIMPVPHSFFRTSYTPTAEEESLAASTMTRNIVESPGGIGNWGGTCTCPDGQAYRVSDVTHNGGARLACYGGTHSANFLGAATSSHFSVSSNTVDGVDGVTISSDNHGGKGQRVICAGNRVEFEVPGTEDAGGSCTCADGRVYPVGSIGGSLVQTCINGIAGQLTATNPGGTKVRVTCSSSLCMPNSCCSGAVILSSGCPTTQAECDTSGCARLGCVWSGGTCQSLRHQPAPEPPNVTTMWGAVQAGDTKAFTDGAPASSGGFSGASVFWGFRVSAGGTAPRFGSGSGAADLI